MALTRATDKIIGDSNGNLNLSGIITASSFVGSGSNLTGVASTDNIKTSTTANFTDGINVVGLITATSGINLVGNDSNVGSSIKLGNASGIVTATTFSGSGANLTNIPDSAISTLTASKLSGALPAISGASLTGVTAVGLSTTASLNTSGIVTAKAFVSDTSLSHRNMIINGAMNVAQRSTSKAITGGGYHTLDRFATVANSSMTYAVTMSQENDNPDGNGKSVKLLTTTAKTPSGSENYILRYKGEEQDISGAGLGTSSCKQLTISFSVKTNKTGTHGFQIYLYNNSPNMTVAYTVSSANTWERKTITLPTYTTSYTHGADNAQGFMIDWNLSSGPDDIMSPYNWATGSTAARGVTGQVNMLDTVGNYFQLTNVQLEIGDTATSFEHRSFGEELFRCQRYYETCHSYGTAFGTNTSEGKYLQNGTTNGAGNQQVTIYFRTTKRANPTVTGHYNGTVGSWYGARSGAAAVTSVSFDLIGMNSFRAYNGIGANFAASEQIGHWQAEAEL